MLKRNSVILIGFRQRCVGRDNSVQRAPPLHIWQDVLRELRSKSSKKFG
jgi:hypothetical protein